MTLISEFSLADYVWLHDRVANQLVGCTSLEEAAQRYMSVLYESLHQSVVLARLFVTLPFSTLPESSKSFVMNLAQSAGIADQIRDETLVLSLMGTRGDKPEWNDRLNSKEHLAIPLVSSDFVGSISMVSRLLKQLGVDLAWIDSNDTRLVARTFENVSGVFHVRDARTEVDSQKRKIIAAQDFVEAEGIKTVFGVGGCYLGTSVFFVSVVFLREYIERESAERFILQANKFKTATLFLVDEGKLFAGN